MRLKLSYICLATVISFMITTYHGLIECTPISEPFAASCQPYKVECDIIPKSNFDFNCSAKLPAFSGMECAELHPPPDICKQLTVVNTTPGVTAVAKGGLADVTISESMYCSSKSVEVNVTCNGAVDTYQMNNEPLYINLTFTPPDVELYIVETQTSNQMKTENQMTTMTLVCNASNFNAAIKTITFFGPNKLVQVCPNLPATENFPDGTITRSGQICSLKILKPSLTHGGAYYCQVRPIDDTCFDYKSSQVEVILTTVAINNISNSHGTPAALISVSSICALALLVMALLVVFLVVLCRKLRKKRTRDPEYEQIRYYGS